MTSNTAKAFLQNNGATANTNETAKRAKLNAMLFGQDPFRELPLGVTPAVDEERDYRPANGNFSAPQYR